MAEFFTDALNGNDSNAGTSAAPFATIQKGWDSVGGGDILHCANTLPFVFSSSLTNNTGFSGGTNRDNFVTIRAWDNGGSITMPDGSVGFEIDGNDSASTIFSSTSTPAYVAIAGIRAYDFTAAAINVGNIWYYDNCEFYGCGGTEQFIVPRFGRAVNIISRDPDTNTRCVTMGLAAYADGLKLTGNTGNQPALAFTNDYAVVINALINDNSADDFGNVFISRHFCVLAHSTLNGKNYAGLEAIYFSGGDASLVYNNLITNYNGTSGKAFRFSASTPQGLLGYNNEYNNGASDAYQISGIDRTDQDVIEASDPYTDEASDDLSLASGASANDTGHPNLS